MSKPYRRPGVPTTPQETAFVSHLIVYAMPPTELEFAQQAIDAHRPQFAVVSDAEDARLCTISDDEFTAFLASEGLLPDNVMAISCATAEMSIEARTAAFQRVLNAIGSGDFDAVSQHDLAACVNPIANRRHRQWIASGKLPLPLHDPDGPLDCSVDVLVRVSTGFGRNGQYRIFLEHDHALKLEPGDLVFISRQFPRPDPKKRR